MSLDRITMYQSGWLCPDCKKHNTMQGFFCHKCGDMVHCHFCRSNFLVATMSIEDDPIFYLEAKRKDLEKDIALLVHDFIKSTNKIPCITTHKSENHPNSANGSGVVFQMEVKLEDKCKNH